MDKWMLGGSGGGGVVTYWDGQFVWNRSFCPFTSAACIALR